MIEAGCVDDLRAALPRLYEDAKRAAGINGIMAVITPWFATYQQPKRSDPEWEAWWTGYVIVCGNDSEEALAAAMEAWAKRGDAEFLPKPGALHELARSVPTPGFKFAGRVQKVLQATDELEGRRRIAADIEARKTTTEEQAAAVAGMLHDFQARNTGVAARQRRLLERGWKFADQPDPPPRDNSDRLAPGSALTPLMLQILGRPIPSPEPPDDGGFSEFD